MKWSMLLDLSVHNMSLPFNHTCCLGKSELGTCLRFCVSENRNRKQRSESSFLSPLLPIVQFDLPKVPHLLRFPFRRLHEIPQLVRCHHQLVLHIDTVFSLDLRAYCSAIPVSRLLTVLRRPMISVVHIVGLCRFHFSVQVEIENVVFEIDWNKFALSIPVHQFLDMHSHSLTKFAVNRNHVSSVMSEVEILSSFARDLYSTAQNIVYTNESSIQRSEQSISVASLKLPSSTIRNALTTGRSIESSISCSLWTKAQSKRVHRFIFTLSNRFELLVALTSNPPSENELAEVSYVCSQPSCHPTELKSSFHSSKLELAGER